MNHHDASVGVPDDSSQLFGGLAGVRRGPGRVHRQTALAASLPSAFLNFHILCLCPPFALRKPHGHQVAQDQHRSTLDTIHTHLRRDNAAGNR